ncbi:hypothetical protein LCGC14_1882080 [marine sediment metagenome]|uniref:Uncharacterized protein n=1 Tax=marine sediment metagenome TaxID=412755 RepID=A0A0F9J0C7_9ZZZZ
MLEIITKFAGENTGWLLAIAAAAGLIAWITRTMRIKGEVARRERLRLEQRATQEQDHRAQIDTEIEDLEDSRRDRRDRDPDDEPPLSDSDRRAGLGS